MATGKSYLEYIQDQCAGLELSFRPMMGEYILYFRDRIAGGLYDDRMLVKDVPAARALMPDAPLQAPYPGAKGMLLVEDTDDRAFLSQLMEAMYPELPAPKAKKRKVSS